MGATTSAKRIYWVVAFRISAERTVCADIDDSVDVETVKCQGRVEGLRCSDIPDNLVRDGTHLVGEAILMPTILFRRDGD